MLNQLVRLPGRTGAAAKTIRGPEPSIRQSVRIFLSLIAVCALALFSGQAHGENQQSPKIKFVNVADSTQGLSDFSQFPAINHRGAVAFLATQDGVGQEVIQWNRRNLTTIASTTDPRFALFTDDLVINSSGVVGFRAILTSGRRAAGIFTGDGLNIQTIVNSTDDGLSGPSLGAPSINASGTVAFQAARSGLASTIIFTGNGGPLTSVLDIVNSNFTTFGAVAINARGEIVFHASQKDRSEGVFLTTPHADATGNGTSTGPAAVIDIIDSNHTEFFQFGDPVINDAGVVADSAGGGLSLEIFSGNGKGITARNDPTNRPFIDVEHPSINGHGAVAFSTFQADGGQAIFVEVTGGASPVAILQTGDPLFGSKVTVVSVGRFAFNDRFQLAFQYELENGVSGIAVAKLQSDGEGKQESSENEESGWE
jgi:hypothetical protein